MLALLLGSLGAMAQDRTPRVDQRQDNQRLRIRQGWVNGDLTRREAARLIAAERFISRHERLAKQDGRVTPSERIQLRRMQQRVSRHIYRERHDRQRPY
jgi:hypothetical protein